MPSRPVRHPRERAAHGLEVVAAHAAADVDPDAEGESLTAVAEDAAAKALTVHRMQGSSSGIAWLYLWTCGKDTYRQAEKPDGADAMREEVSISEIRVCGALKPTNRVTEALRKRMEDLEII